MNSELYAKKLSAMIQAETISHNTETEEDRAKFAAFRGLLKELFPRVFAAAEEELFHGSLLLRIPGCGNEKPILFMNHYDVVEATGDWKYPPFSGAIAEGKVWGRGALDTKGGLFSMLQAMEELLEAGFTPARDIYFESACTEETSGNGGKEIADTLYERGVEFECLYDEGGMVLYDPIGGAKAMIAMIGVGEKGAADIRFVARSNGGHASMPGKDTPLVRLGKFMAYVDNHEVFDVELSPTIQEMLRRVAPFMGNGVKQVAGNPKAFKPLLEKLLPGLSVAAGALLKTTIAFTMAQGSDGYNVLPEQASVIGNMRYSHHQGRDASIKAISDIAAKFDIDTEVLEPGTPSLICDYKGRAFTMAEEAVKNAFPELDAASPYLMLAASDARFFDKVCSQSIRFVPFYISAEQLASIHGLNECVDISTLAPAVNYYKYLMQNL